MGVPITVLSPTMLMSAVPKIWSNLLGEELSI
jgi:hypothetical protein